MPDFKTGNNALINIALLLDQAKETSAYFQIKSAITGIPGVEEGFVDKDTLLNKVLGTDKYEPMKALVAEQLQDYRGVSCCASEPENDMEMEP